VAVKIFRPSHRGRVDWRQHLRHEAERVAQLHHPGIVPLLEMGEGEGWGYLTFPLIPGGNLRQIMHRGRLAVKQAARIVADVGAALADAHFHEVVHRDVKPDNVLLDRQGRTYLTDFGIAARKGDLRLTAAQGEGTPAYMSPEQLLRAEVTDPREAVTVCDRPRPGSMRRVDPRTDTWSLGVILYELLTGRHPFAGHEAGLREAILTHAPQPPEALDRAVPPALGRVCMTCLSKEPAGRYLNVMDLAADLRRCIVQLPDVSRAFARLTIPERGAPLTGAGGTLATVLARL
jgi:serine/threonine protein kinase